MKRRMISTTSFSLFVIGKGRPFAGEKGMREAKANSYSFNTQSQ